MPMTQWAHNGCNPNLWTRIRMVEPLLLGFLLLIKPPTDSLLSFCPSDMIKLVNIRPTMNHSHCHDDV
ncbi:Uncharacterized protein HZ326_30664 [Fusarium oxysporum f. sp. albedinis]|nr:Uncharacterized protein HZ326_30664 [Fusarium oxysporum f. sp. albedinis]